MKLPLSILRDFVSFDLEASDLAELLTMTGFEVEGLEQIEGDTVLDVKVCSNRGDGLSALGLAREMLAKSPIFQATDLYKRASLRFPKEDDSVPCELKVPIEIQTESCSRFAYRGFRGLGAQESPEWIQKRLRQMGMRPISLMVDLTNYVMVELGQPLHAYDLSLLEGPGIIVRQARTGEKVTTLNGDVHELLPNQMMICDLKKPIGVAGVMGGLNTEISSTADFILLESAHFSNTSVRKTRKQLGLNTEASYRFERSVDREGVVAALNRVKELLIELGYGQNCLQGVTDIYPGKQLAAAIEFSALRASNLLGFHVDESEMHRVLTALGCTIRTSGGVSAAVPPSWRTDLLREEDLVEEVGRILGYENIPELLPFGSTSQGGVHGFYGLQDELISKLSALGFDQAMTHSLCGKSPLEALDEKVHLRNPNSPETAFMRNSLLPGLAEVMKRNGTEGGHYFEVGPIFRRENSTFVTSKSVAALSSGPLFPLNRKGEFVPNADFFSLKSVLGHLIPGEFEFSEGTDMRFQPFHQARFTSSIGDGIIGKLHPLICLELQLPGNTFGFEWSLNGKVYDDFNRGFKALSRNPSVRRDISFLISKEVGYDQIELAIRTELKDVLEGIWLFDVYEGKGIDPGFHSLAIALTLRKIGSNFTDEEANQVRERAVGVLASLGAIRR